MAKYALILNLEVKNLVEANQDYVDSVSHNWDYIVQSDTANIGDTYDPGSGTFTPAPLPPEKPFPIIRTIRIDKWLDRWDDETFGRVLRLAENDTAIGNQIKGWIKWLDRQSAISLDDTRIVNKLDYALTNSFITQQEHDDLLADVQPGEL